MTSCHATAEVRTALPSTIRVTVALAGQPNVGKSTVFNVLTGLNQHVGNWPGKTIEQRIGIHHHDGIVMTIVDLPGTYSLTANSQEELIAREFIITQRPDVVAVIVDAAILERSLYLVAELMALDVPIVIGLNMMDVAREQGVQIEAHVMQAALGVPVIPMVASSNQGVRELVQAIADVATKRLTCNPNKPDIRADHRAVLQDVLHIVRNAVPEHYPPEWVALKLLEGDPAVTTMMQSRLSPEDWQAAQDLLHRHEDAALAIASGRYEWIGRIVRAAMVIPRQSQISVTERLDRIATHPIWGLGLFGLMLAMIFGLTYTLAAPIQRWLESVIVGGLGDAMARLLVTGPGWLSALVIDGIIGGMGTVLTVIPILAIFFTIMALLEDVGYMARAAYVMDSFMHPMGLHGKSFLPLFLGFGCNVPAVQGTRIIEEPRARLLTILLTPLVPCTARMAVVAFMAPLFFGQAATFVSWGLIMLSIIILGFMGLILSKTVIRGEPLAFIMELPLYHRPHLRSIALLVWQRCLAFVQRAGTIILIMSVIVWALSWLPSGNLETSLLATAGRALSLLGAAMGLDWKMLVALLTSFVAKENTIATLGVLVGSGESGESLAYVLPTMLSPAAALAFLVVQVLFIPCVATMATIRQETGSWRWTLFSLVSLLLTSFVAGIAVYQGGRLF